MPLIVLHPLIVTPPVPSARSPQVTDPSGQQLHWQHDVAEGHFGFTADETGEFSVCFWLPHEGHHDVAQGHLPLTERHITLHARSRRVVTDPSGQQLHWQHDVAEGHFGFTADETGEFSVCFWLPHEGHHDAKRTHKIDITWTTGKSQKSVSHGAKKERLDHFDLELQNLEDAIDKVTQEMSFFHERELAMRMKTEETHVYVAWLSVASLLVCGTIAALQLWHLKRFFERKKLL
ncbi:unnamed protein product [Closterium sp. Naga37s-1]|nr:unnamed protein product [Closterium sp. Naga37s-1]